MSRRRAFPPRRLLVALDASAASLTALEAALALARRYGASVEAVFVEDARWGATAGHPGARHVHALSGAGRSAGAEAMAEAAAALQHEARRRLTALATRARVQATFRALRGAVEGLLLEASGEADLVCLGRTGWGSRGLSALGRTAQALLASSGAAVLLLRAGESPERPVAVWLPCERPSEAALAAALALAREDGGRLLVLLAGGAPEEREQARRTVEAAAATAGVTPHLLPVPGSSGEALAAALRGLEVRTLVVPADVLSAEGGAGACLAAVRCPVLAVR